MMPQPPRRKHKKKPLAEIIQKLLKYGKEVFGWASSVTMAEWLQDTKSIRATAMDLQIIGEEVNTLFIMWEDLLARSDFCEPVAMSRWQGLRYLRHGISHEYDRIDEINFYHEARDLLSILHWAEAIERNLNGIEKEEAEKSSPRSVFSPYD